MKRDVLTDSGYADTWTWSPAQKKTEKRDLVPYHLCIS